ncbi:hypothetical protein [Mucilaginibacter sp.]|jgi:hypothetical protein|uniref:hypothetical protein n=1 Tax=Mucilaginibacter sp. TaxID=1882438 RepID=UPI003563FDBE
MKYVAVLLLLNMLLLCSVLSVTNIHHETAACCIKNTHKNNPEQPKHSADNNCAKGTCTAMLFCGTCGFIITPPVYVSPAIIDLDNQVAPHFIAGELSDYQDNDWNPPKA